MTELDWGPWMSLIVRAVALLLYADHTWYALADLRKRPNGRTYRSALLAVVVLIGVFAIFLGGLAQVWNELAVAARLVGAISAGALLVGGLFLWINRRQEVD